MRVAVLNPAQLHSYAQSLPRRGKTDALDAQVFVRFAAERKPAPWTPPPAVYHELRQRLVARDGLLSMRQQARNQRHALQQWPVTVASVLTQLDEVIAELDRRLASLEDEIADVLADGAWATSAALLNSIPGIGLVTTAWLLVSTLNFSLCATPEQAAAYAGSRAAATGVGDERAWAGTTGSRRKWAVADGVVFGELVSDALQPGDQGLLRAVAGSRQANESRALCGRAEVVACGMGGGDQRAAV